MAKTRANKKSNGGGPTRYALYLRCSTDEQAQGDYTTIDTQRELTTRCVAQRGGKLGEEYPDEGWSGTTLERPAFKRLLADARAGKFDAVCITEMSRLARGPMYEVAEYLLKEAGVTVVTVNERFSDDMAGYTHKAMTNFMNGMYPQMVRGWTNTKMEQMVAKGYVTGYYNALGYKKEFVAGEQVRGDKRAPQRLAVDPETAPIVVLAFEIFVETRQPAPVRTYLQTVTGERWSYDRVRRLLTNEVYRGVLRFGKWENKSAFEPIISEVLWNAAQEVERRRTRAPKAKPVDTFPYYLRGLVRCPHCGCAMTTYWTRGTRSIGHYYQCGHAMRKITSGCPVNRVNANTLHNAVLAEIERAARYPTRMAALIAEAVKALPTQENRTQEVMALTKRLKDLDKRIGNVREAVETGSGAVGYLVERLDALLIERVTVEQELRQIEAEVEATKVVRPAVEEVCRLYSRFMELWQQATDDEREILMQNLVVSVEMEDKGKGTCELLLMPEVPAAFLDSPREGIIEINSHLGAGGIIGSINPRRVPTRFFVPPTPRGPKVATQF